MDDKQARPGLKRARLTGPSISVLRSLTLSPAGPALKSPESLGGRCKVPGGVCRLLEPPLQHWHWHMSIGAYRKQGLAPPFSASFFRAFSCLFVPFFSLLAAPVPQQSPTEVWPIV